MGLMDQIKADAAQIITNGDEFGVAIAFVAPNAATATVNGLVRKHHLGIDQEGVAVNSKLAGITIVESALTTASYPVRNASGEVALTGHRVTWKDANGTSLTYVIRETFPDEVLGVIVCFLADYN